MSDWKPDADACVRFTHEVAYISDAEHGIHFREIEQFVEPVIWPDGKLRPRFSSVAVAEFDRGDGDGVAK